MDKKIIDKKFIKEYLHTQQEIHDIEQFCEWLLANETVTDVKVGLKELLIKRVCADNQEDKRDAVKRLFRENVEWIRNNCSFLEEVSYNMDNDDIPSGEIKPDTDFDKVKQEFESEGYKKLHPLEASELDYTASELDDAEGIVLREGGIITQQDKVQMYVSKDGVELEPSKVLIVEAEGNGLLALGYLIPENATDYTVVFENKECIDYSKFSGISQARFVVYGKDGEAYSRLIDIDFRPFSYEKYRPLCIDFGTSNTTVGSYGILDRDADEAEIVKFIDVTVNPNNTEAMLMPTIVYVEDCSDPEDIKYLFGFEARKRIEDEHYESKASVYYEIKRWMSSANEKEEIRDNRNHKASPERKKIIKAYIDYVIEYSEQYFATRFKKLHFSAPVKLKEQFINIFTELYKGEKIALIDNERTVLSADESIDEGIAIVYNQIVTMMDEDSKSESDKKSIMIMDCGGGTTDLASCEFSYRSNTAGYELTLDTCFENGNSNFGGNNITYRIMQLLKIKIAAMLCPDLIEDGGEVIKLIDKSENEILGLVEEEMQHNPYDSDKASSVVYNKFLDNYNKAEDIIPTQYTGNKKYRGSEQRKMIKRNFYYLWRQAEQIKIEFYRTERVMMEFSEAAADAEINIRNKDNYYLYIAKERSSQLKKIDKPFDKVSITIKEINRVICGDIYSLLVGLFHNGELTSKKKKVDEFNYYKLSGQSCKISLFSELIKEYIPGRKFRPAIRQEGMAKKRNSEDLKLDCVLGSINYIKDQLRPEMNIVTNPGFPEIIYNVSLKGSHNSDKKLFDCTDTNKIHMEVSHKNTREYPLVISGKEEIVEREFIFSLRDSREKYKKWTTEEIRNKISNNSIVSEEGIDAFIGALSGTIHEEQEIVNIVFIVPAKLGYGFYIGQIQAKGTEDDSEYILLQFNYENFEDASKTFFDGRR